MQLVDCAGLPVIRKMPPISAVAGEQLAVTCPAAGFPIHAVTWEKGKKSQHFSTRSVTQCASISNTVLPFIHHIMKAFSKSMYNMPLEDI